MRLLDSLGVAVLATALSGCSPETATESFDVILKRGEVLDGTV